MRWDAFRVPPQLPKPNPVRPSGGVRKVKFAPKIPATRKKVQPRKTEEAEGEVVDNDLHRSIYQISKVRTRGWNARDHHALHRTGDSYAPFHEGPGIDAQTRHAMSYNSQDTAQQRGRTIQNFPNRAKGQPKRTGPPKALPRAAGDGTDSRGGRRGDDTVRCPNTSDPRRTLPRSHAHNLSAGALLL
eukprot:4767263-Pyramimonas_sp.AAC.2